MTTMELSKPTRDWMMKEAASVTALTRALKSTVTKPRKPYTWEGAKRFFSRRPELADILPEGAKKVKTDKAGSILSYLDPKSGYKHTAKTPSLLHTIGTSAINAPRIFTSPKLDKLSKRLYQGSVATYAGKGAYDINEERLKYDTNVQTQADKIRTDGHDVLADLTEQGKSQNVASRLVGQNKYSIPEEHFLAPLNHILGNVNKSAVKEAIIKTIHSSVSGTPSGANRLKTLFKPPVVSSGLIGATTKNVLGKPKSGIQIGQSILKDSLTPEASEEMAKTPNGRIIMAVLNKAKTMPGEDAQAYIYEALKRAESLWKELSSQGNLTAASIEAKIKELL